MSRHMALSMNVPVHVHVVYSCIIAFKKKKNKTNMFVCMQANKVMHMLVCVFRFCANDNITVCTCYCAGDSQPHGEGHRDL